MAKFFSWNELADQPHNVAPRKERFRAHWHHAGSYLSLFGTNLALMLPVLCRYKRIREKIYNQPVDLRETIGVAVSPVESKEEEIISLLRELGVRHVLVRVPSWEINRLSLYEGFIKRLHQEGWAILVALLQNRYDVLEPERWQNFLKQALAQLSPWARYFEIGHAWNRTKWGLWSYREYLNLVRPAAVLAGKYQIKIVGPAVIDFEFHLYPEVLKEIPFDIISSLLYVDRTGAPENAQWGWTLEKKIALLRAIIESTSCRGKACWITEFNWPLEGMGPYSPAPGRPCVSEEEQANFLVRYFVLGLSSGSIQRIYWWQLMARGYGLVDPLASPWRRRPSFYAFKTMTSFLEGSTFLKREFHPKAWIFYFIKGNERMAVAWTKQGVFHYEFSQEVREVFNRDGQALPFSHSKIELEPRPKYVFFQINSF